MYTVPLCLFFKISKSVQRARNEKTSNRMSFFVSTLWNWSWINRLSCCETDERCSLGNKFDRVLRTMKGKFVGTAVEKFEEKAERRWIFRAPQEARSDNPEVMWFKSHLRNQKSSFVRMRIYFFTLHFSLFTFHSSLISTLLCRGFLEVISNSE